VLNPDTSSDSPSAKSKGVRLDSAIQLIIQNVGRGNTSLHDRKKTASLHSLSIKEFKESLTVNTNKARPIS